MTKIFQSGETPFEKKEQRESVDFREKKGDNEYEAWHATRASVRSGAVLDPRMGQDVVIRNFIVLVQKNSRSGTMEEVLHATLPMIKKNVIKDGWTFQREPTIRKGKNKYIITAVLEPAFKHGLRIGATNDTARSATDLLNEAAKKQKK